MLNLPTHFTWEVEKHFSGAFQQAKLLSLVLCCLFPDHKGRYCCPALETAALHTIRVRLQADLGKPTGKSGGMLLDRTHTCGNDPCLFLIPTQQSHRMDQNGKKLETSSKFWTQTLPLANSKHMAYVQANPAKTCAPLGSSSSSSESIQANSLGPTCFSSMSFSCVAKDQAHRADPSKRDQRIFPMIPMTTWSFAV